MIKFLPGLLVGMLTGSLGFWLRQNTGLTIVQVSAWLTLGGGLILPRLSSDGLIWALICTCVSYAVMSDTNRIGSYKEIIMVSIICSFVVYYGQDVLAGIGGRLGTFAALSVLIFNFIKGKVQGRRGCDQINAESGA